MNTFVLKQLTTNLLEISTQLPKSQKNSQPNSTTSNANPKQLITFTTIYLTTFHPNNHPLTTTSVLALAYGTSEDNMIFLGVVAMIDPPRDGVEHAIRVLHDMNVCGCVKWMCVCGVYVGVCVCVCVFVWIYMLVIKSKCACVCWI